MLDQDKNPDLDQTQFGSEGWLFEANKKLPQVDASQISNKPIWWQTKNGRIILIGVAISMMLGLLLIGASLNKSSPQVAVDEKINETTGELIDLGPLGLKTRNLKEQLKLADPTKELDPYPPVRVDLRLDKAAI